MALGDIVKINESGETQYNDLTEAFASLPQPLDQDTVFEVRTNNAISGVVVSEFLNPSYTLEIKNGVGFSGSFENTGVVLDFTNSNNITLNGLNIDDTDDSGDGAIVLSGCSSIIIKNSSIDGYRGLYATNSHNISYYLNDGNYVEQLTSFTSCNNILLNSSYTFNSPGGSDSYSNQFVECDYVLVSDMRFTTGSYRQTALRFEGCGNVDVNRCLFQVPTNNSSVGCISVVTAAGGTRSIENITVDSCVFELARTAVDASVGGNVCVKNCTLYSNDWQSTTIYVLKFENMDHIEIYNNAFDITASTATQARMYRLSLNAGRLKEDYVLSNNSYFATVADQWTIVSTSDWGGGATYSDVTAIQAQGLEDNSNGELSTYINSTTYLVDVGSNARNGALMSKVSYLDYNKEMKPTDTADRGAVDNDSVPYSENAITLQCSAYNPVDDTSNLPTDTEFALPALDYIYLFPIPSIEAVKEYSWKFTGDNGQVIVDGKNPYFTVTEDIYDLELTVLSEGDVEYTLDLTDYLIAEVARPTASFNIESASSLIFTDEDFNLINTSQYATSYLWQVETTPDSGVYDEYTTEDVIAISKANPGNYNIILTSTNSAPLTGIRNTVYTGTDALKINERNYVPIFDVECTNVVHEGDEVEFSIVPKNNFTIEKIEWEFQGGSKDYSWVKKPTVTYNTRGAYDLRVKVYTTDGYAAVVYKRRIVSVLPSLEGRTVHVVDLATLPEDSDRPWEKVMLDNDTLGASPGDVIQLRGSVEDNYGLVIKNFEATSDDNPYIIGNYPGEVSEINYSNWKTPFNNGIYLKYCSFVIFDFKIGNNSNDFYGLKMDVLSDMNEQLDGGFKMEKFSTNIEITGIHMVKAGFPAYQAKTEPISENVNDPRWDGFAFRDIKIHNIRIDECRGEYFYLGYNNTLYQESGSMPHENINGLIYRNYCAKAQKDGFQYGNASGVWEIHDNVFKDTATLNAVSQNSGMSVNQPRENCFTYIYNNVLDGFPAYPLQVWIAKEMYIFNNVFRNQSNAIGQVYVHNDCIGLCDVHAMFNNTFVGIGSDGVVNLAKTPLDPARDPNNPNPPDPLPPVPGVRTVDNFYVVNNIHIVADENEISVEAGNADKLTTFDHNEIHGYNGIELEVGIPNNYTVSNNIFYGQSRIDEFLFVDEENGDVSILKTSIADSTGTEVDLSQINLARIGMTYSDAQGYQLYSNEVDKDYDIGAYSIPRDNRDLQDNSSEFRLEGECFNRAIEFTDNVRFALKDSSDEYLYDVNGEYLIPNNTDI